MILMDATITDPAAATPPKAVPISGPGETFDAHAAVPDAGMHCGIVHARMDPSAATENNAREPAGVLAARTTQIQQCTNWQSPPGPGLADGVRRARTVGQGSHGHPRARHLHKGISIEVHFTWFREGLMGSPLGPMAAAFPVDLQGGRPTGPTAA